MEKTAVFPGTFNPFTIGHQSIVERGLAIFDRIIIAIGNNANKPAGRDFVKRFRDIKKVFEDNPAVEVTVYSGLTAQFAKTQVPAPYCAVSETYPILNTREISRMSTKKCWA